MQVISNTLLLILLLSCSSAKLSGTQDNSKSDNETIQNIISNNFGKIKNCEDSIVKNKHLLKGAEIFLNFQITSEGKTNNAEVSGPEHEEFISCVLKVLNSIEFPKVQSRRTFEIKTGFKLNN